MQQMDFLSLFVILSLVEIDFLNYYYYNVLYSQSGIEHVHVQYKTYTKRHVKVLKSTKIINNFGDRLFRIHIIVV